MEDTTALNYRNTGKFSNTMLKSGEDPWKNLEDLGRPWKTQQLSGCKLQNYRQILKQYVEINGRPNRSVASNYKTTGKFFNIVLKSVEDPTTLSCQTTELQGNF